MPVCSIHLLSLRVSIPRFLSDLSASDIKPLTIARVVRWVVLPTSTSTTPLLTENIHWDVLITLPGTGALPSNLQQLIQHQWTVQAGIPTRLLVDFQAKNKRLLKPQQEDVPPLTGSLKKPRVAISAQALELSPELQTWVEEFGRAEGAGAVSMLNLLAFKPGLKEQYLKYGAEFAKSIGSRRGGEAKLVGSIIHTGKETDTGHGWDEMALAHYPSIYHFADMLASEDYQVVNKQYRVGSLKDTFILCTSELDLDNGGLWTKANSKL